MTQPPLRLVVDHGGDTAPTAFELQPNSGAVLHIHLYMATQEAPQPSQAAVWAHVGRERGQPERGTSRPLLLGVGATLVALVAFVFGARSGAGHAEALAAARTGVAGLASLATLPTVPQVPARSGELPASVQQQLAQQPTVTIPPGAAAAGGADPFGLQH